jgi:putative ABC transport system ATP-binding protein
LKEALMPLVRIEHITKDYVLGKTIIHALRDVTFQVDAGEFLSVVGPSGCGKTTLLNCIGCIDRPSTGSIFFDGQDVSLLNDDGESDMRLERIGFIFQSFHLIPVLTVTENVEFPLILAKAPKKSRRDRVCALIDAVGLGEYAKHRPDELSGGQRQRVAIARALVNEPALVIADEPTANLDSETGEMILGIMTRLNRERGVTFIFSTHNPEVMKHAKRTVRLKDGTIQSAAGEHAV